MQTVYNANTGLEAHMIKNLLWQHEIESEVLGEHLQGGIGELSAIGMVRVLVSDEDVTSAQTIIREWESSHPDEQYDQNRLNPHTRLADVVLGFVLGVASVLLILRLYP